MHIYAEHQFCFQNAVYKPDTHSHSSGTDEPLIEHLLSNKELQALKEVLQIDVIDSLRLELGNAQTTLEKVQRLLHSVGHHETASNLRQHLDFGELSQIHRKSTILLAMPIC